MTRPELQHRAAHAARRFLALAVPHGMWVLRGERLARRREEILQRAAADSGTQRASHFSVEEAIRYLRTRGLDEAQVRAGSMPEPSLRYASHLMGAHVPTDRPVRALHVGNFVGVSLAYFTAFLKERHPSSVVLSIDPNVEHRGIRNPQDHVLALLGHFDLLPNSLVIPGYSLEQNLGDDPPDDATQAWTSERACERVLANLAGLCGRRFDLVLIDGNHEGDYLARELEAVGELLAEGGLVVVDDVEWGRWDDIARVFEETVRTGGSFEEVGRDGRAGLFRRRVPVATA